MLAAVTLMGVGSVVAKASALDGPVLALHRAWGAAAIYVGLFLAVGGRINRTSLRAAAPGGLFFGFELALFFSSIQLTTVANATMLIALQPVAVLLFFSRRFDEVVTRRQVVLSVVALVGVGLVVFGSTGSPSWSPLGDLLGVGALAAWTLYFVWSKEPDATSVPSNTRACPSCSARRSCCRWPSCSPAPSTPGRASGGGSWPWWPSPAPATWP